MTFNCAQCGAEVVRRRKGVGLCRACSQKRNAVLATAAKVPRELVTRACEHCGKEFQTSAPEERRKGRRFCSQRCMGDAYSQEKAITGEFVGIQRWSNSREKACVVCGATKDLHLHHIITRQQLCKVGGDIHDPRNGLTVCARCHARHHSRYKPLPLSLVLARRPEVVRFAAELGLTWYLSRNYGPIRPRSASGAIR